MLPKTVQLVLFSATFPEKVKAYATIFAPGANQMHLKQEELTVEGIKQTLIGQGKLESGDIFINTLSMPLTQARRTNTVKLSTVD